MAPDQPSYCTACGAELLPGGSFCPSCGVNQTTGKVASGKKRGAVLLLGAIGGLSAAWFLTWLLLLYAAGPSDNSTWLLGWVTFTASLTVIALLAAYLLARRRALSYWLCGSGIILGIAAYVPSWILVFMFILALFAITGVDLDD